MAPLTYWLLDYDEEQLTVAFQPAKQGKIFKLTLMPDSSDARLQQFTRLMSNLAKDDQHTYISYASRFWEMPLLVFANRQSAQEIIALVNERQKYLTSLDSPFTVINQHRQLWNDAEVNLLSSWQHNEYFLDIRTLDGRIDHGELSRYQRYLVQANFPLPTSEMSLADRVALELANRRQLFLMPHFQLAWSQHRAILARYQQEITADPHEKWQGMMTIMPTTTDAETIEAILYRDHHIIDRPVVTLPTPAKLELTTPWAKQLFAYYHSFDQIDRHNPVALARARLKNKHYRPPVIDNHGTPFALIPSEDGIHGFPINRDAFAQTSNFQQATAFNQPNTAPTVIKIERPLIHQELMLDLGVFDDHARQIVGKMISNVNAHYPQATKESHLEQKLLHALKGAADTSFDNHLKQPNTILQVRLTTQLIMIKLCQQLIKNGYRLLSVNTTLLYVTPTPRANPSFLQQLPDQFKVTDRGTKWFAKSANDHLYRSNDGTVKVAGDNTNHYRGPNVYTDQQRPTVTETVLVEYLLAAGNKLPINERLLRQLLENHLTRGFQPAEWIQPIITSKLKQIFTIADKKSKAIVANPVLRGFFVTTPTEWKVVRLYGSNQRPKNSQWVQELAGRADLSTSFYLTRRYLKLEQNHLFDGRHLSLVFDPQKIDLPSLKRKIDREAYCAIIKQMLTTWLAPSPQKTQATEQTSLFNWQGVSITIEP